MKKQSAKLSTETKNEGDDIQMVNALVTDSNDFVAASS
jgi:hypothetical protein